MNSSTGTLAGVTHSAPVAKRITRRSGRAWGFPAATSRMWGSVSRAALFRAWILPSRDIEPEQSASQKKRSGRLASSPPGRLSTSSSVVGAREDALPPSEDRAPAVRRNAAWRHVAHLLCTRPRFGASVVASHHHERPDAAGCRSGLAVAAGAAVAGDHARAGPGAAGEDQRW